MCDTKWMVLITVMMLFSEDSSKNIFWDPSLCLNVCLHCLFGKSTCTLKYLDKYKIFWLSSTSKHQVLDILHFDKKNTSTLFDPNPVYVSSRQNFLPIIKWYHGLSRQIYNFLIKYINTSFLPRVNSLLWLVCATFHVVPISFNARFMAEWLARWPQQWVRRCLQILSALLWIWHPDLEAIRS